jgi:hypothetical protein
VPEAHAVAGAEAHLAGITIAVTHQALAAYTTARADGWYVGAAGSGGG